MKTSNLKSALTKIKDYRRKRICKPTECRRSKSPN